ncbi:EP300-interacting inhibitor of differentiation 3 isoform X2 [Halyomorpha halys]|uniref:EP300-interacting inhibitor of differentiation 3 isoform X2 n=1 Tax=Halyomorpha halys TaxID=286706 RepID=UPI0006D4D31B|nr:EP300-interacting inhibitor of differentiation 3 isoform X2 [Halyomorpha halys]
MLRNLHTPYGQRTVIFMILLLQILVKTTAECVANSRVIDVATTKLIDDVQKLDLSSIDLWTDIAERLVIGWNKFFLGPNNVEDWSLGNLVPLNRSQSVFFNSRSLLLKKKNPEQRVIASQKKPRIMRKDDNSQSKTAKPLQGFAEDKPPLLIEHMERIKSVLGKLSTKNGSSVPYMKLVLHPTSFPCSVYNIFAVAFLVREGMALLTIGKDDEPMVQLLSNSHTINPENDNRKKSNFLVSLTTEEWQVLVNKLEITAPLIPSPDGIQEEDEFYEKFTMSQKERRKKKND